MTGDSRNVLQVDGLSVSFQGLHGQVPVLHDISFKVSAGEVVGIVGESGSGKSVTSLAIMGLLGAQGSVDGGRVRLGDQNLTGLRDNAMRRIRGRDIAMIFQEPTTSLNPVLPVGFQIAEVLVEHFGQGEKEAGRRAVELMHRVGIPAAAERALDYPHQLSGGMKQRIMIAMALACQPKFLIADEPTTALDVTIQAQILDLIRDLRSEFDMGVVLITHDMGIVAEMADRVVVMYAGQIVEQSDVASLFGSPRHPYTRLLLRSIPSARVKQDVLPMIVGTTPTPSDFSAGCRFNPRCPFSQDLCRQNPPPLEEQAESHQVRCHRVREIPALMAQDPEYAA